MKRVLLFLSYFLLFLAFFIYFIPKVNLYYQVENIIKKRDFIISNERVKETMFGIEMENGQIHYRGIHIGELNRLKALLLGAYNEVSLRNLSITDDFAAYFPKKVKSLSLYYSIIHPATIQIKGIVNKKSPVRGTFGIKNKKLHLVIDLSKEPRLQKEAWIHQLKNIGKGVYTYETNF